MISARWNDPAGTLRSLLIVATMLLVATAANAQSVATSATIDFNRQVRPILSDYCFHCHGPDESTRKAKLRLDTREGVMAAARHGGKIVHPGKSAASELIARLVPEDPSELMPPAKSGKKLSAEQIRILKEWVDQGATWSDHWAFVPPQRPATPKVAKADWVRTPIDAFILSRLEKEKLTPSPEADRITLIRRLSLDLTGLPPTPAEVDAFLADKSPDAYEKVVDRLLASRHYGERMAMPWLDYARFADSNGFQTDTSRGMWPWRDWVISAYNANMPFDQFTLEQIAGDLLPGATRSQIVATGFHRNHRLNGEGGIIGEEWRIENIVDRIDTTGLTWLGLTLGCARCHDHRFDPITQKEYYQLFAFFNNVPESGTLTANRTGGNSDPVIPAPTAEQDAEITRLTNAIASAEKAVADAGLQSATPAQFAEAEATLRKQIDGEKNTWNPLSPTSLKATSGATFARQSDGSYFVGGKLAPFDVYTIEAPLAAGSLSGVMLECFPDERLPNKSLGRNGNGNFVLTKVEAEVNIPGQKSPRPISFTRAEADFSQANWDIRNVLNGDKSAGWAVDGPTKREPRQAILVADVAVDVPAGASLTIRLRHESLTNHHIGRFRLATSSAPPSLVSFGGIVVPDSIRAALAVDADKRSPAQTTELRTYLGAKFANPAKKEREELARLQKQLLDLNNSLPTVMVMKEGAPRPAYLLVRGQYDKRGPKVDAALPAVFGSLPADQPANRLALARWIVDPNNPLTARVWVNRAWEHFFGQGFVKSSDNLGSQADVPSHPELLDWLAVEFVARQWNMKAMHKLIVMSSVYRQSSRVTPELRERDPDNRLLTRGARFRLQAELVRDQSLAVAGLLSPRIGGPSVRPYMPAGVWDETSVYGDMRNYKHDKGDGLYRRTMYTIWKRTAAPPTMLLFDAPNREICSVKRSRTNTPLQALALLNEVTYVEAARKLAERMMTEGGETPDRRLTHGFRLATGRTPSATELRVLREGLDADMARFAANPAAAGQLIGFGETPAPPSLNATQLAAFTLAANVLLNLDEVVTRE